MGSIARMDPKPPSSFGYMPRPSLQPIAQNRVFKSEMPAPPPLNRMVALKQNGNTCLLIDINQFIMFYATARYCNAELVVIVKINRQ